MRPIYENYKYLNNVVKEGKTKQVDINKVFDELL